MRLAQKLGIARVVVPADAGVGSAVGFLDAPIGYEVVRTLLVRLDQLDGAAMAALFAEMRAEAEAVVRLGAPGSVLEEVRTGFMRYRGQGHEVPVPLPADGLDPAGLRVAFDETYARMYGRVIPGLEVEALTWILSLAEARGLPAAGEVVMGEEAAGSGMQRIVDPANGAVMEAAVHRRAGLAPGAWFRGPAVVLEDGTSTIVPTGFRVRVAAAGELVIEGGVG